MIAAPTDDPGRHPAAGRACTAEDFKCAMQKLAGTVGIVTTRHQGRRLGLTVTAACSLSVEPPSLLVCINRKAEAHDAICASGRFCLNLLGAGQTALAERFSAGAACRGESRFQSGDWGAGVTGAPVLLGALAHFDCRLSQQLEAGTHSIFIGTVEAVGASADGAPLLYSNRRYAQLA